MHISVMHWLRLAVPTSARVKDFTLSVVTVKFKYRE